VAQEVSDQIRTPGRIVMMEPESSACVSRALYALWPVGVEGSLDTIAEMVMRARIGIGAGAGDLGAASGGLRPGCR
jgi:hypothetical protein